VVNAERPFDIRQWHYQDGRIELKQGEEMGRFLLGSTVVMLWPKSLAEFNPGWRAGAPVRLGEAMASLPSGLTP